jgi:hypothetical protein
LQCAAPRHAGPEEMALIAWTKLMSLDRFDS